MSFIPVIQETDYSLHTGDRDFHVPKSPPVYLEDGDPDEAHPYCRGIEWNIGFSILEYPEIVDYMLENGKICILELECHDYHNMQAGTESSHPIKIPVMYMSTSSTDKLSPGVGFIGNEPWVFSPPFLGKTKDGKYLYTTAELYTEAEVLNPETTPVSVWKIRELFPDKPRKKTKEVIISKLKEVYEELCETNLTKTIGHMDNS